MNQSSPFHDAVTPTLIDQKFFYCPVFLSFISVLYEKWFVMLRYIMLLLMRLLGLARIHHPASVLHSVSFHGVARVHGRERGYLDLVFPVSHTFKGHEITFTRTLHKTGCPSPPWIQSDAAVQSLVAPLRPARRERNHSLCFVVLPKECWGCEQFCTQCCTCCSILLLVK